ncbi:MAG: MATE family efflux transporter [Lachnospiraceae bacterium]|nr:MATE family efflux transporter [Lachnospiraceae bacterium]
MRFALPVLLAMCLQSLYGAVDLLVVGQFGTAAEVSAVATGSQMMQLVTTVFTGLAMGTTIVLGQMIGGGRKKEAGDVIGSSICLFLSLAVAVTILMFIIAIPFAHLMQTPEEAFSQTLSYVRICSGGIVFIVAYNVLGSIFRGIGDSKTPLLTVAIACVFNIAGDLFFVGALHMRAAGAALATVLAQAISVVISIMIIRKKGLPFSFGRENVRFCKRHIHRMVKNGVPIALQDSLVALSFLVINSIVNSLGVIFSAGVGVAEKVCAFIMLVPMSFSQSLSAFVAQNVGAGNYTRAKKSMEYAMGMSIVAGVILAYIAYFHGSLLGSIFTKDHEVIMASADYLKAYAIDTLMVSFLFCFVGYFNGCGYTTFVMIQGLAGAFLVRIPISWFMSRLPETNLFKIGLATPASTIVGMTLCIVYFFVTSRKAD